MDCYIVSIYRRNEEWPQDVAGLVEIVGTTTKKHFHSSRELMEILVNERDRNNPKKGGGTGEIGVEGE